VMPTFTEYLRDVKQFRKFEHELLVLVTEAQRERWGSRQSCSDCLAGQAQ